MKVQPDCESLSTSRLQSNFASHMDHHQPRTGDQHRHVTEAQMKQLNEVRMALKSEFDSMEESLRDALRQECRQNNAKTEISRSTPVCDTTLTKCRNYITVYEHDQMRQPNHFRNNPNLIEHNRTQLHDPIANSGFPANAATSGGNSDMNQVGNIPVDEFQRYCSLLTERIQKMEEQNVELMKLAEHQKVEYKKVVAQVLESEKSQRLLLSECNSLRQQVQQLATHNRKLKEQHLLGNAPQSLSTAEADPVIQSTTSCHSDKHAHQTTNNAGENSKEVFKQLHGHSVPFLERYESFDIASIVELYAALQKETLTDSQSPAVYGQCTSLEKQKAGSFSDHGTPQIKSVNHKRTESDKIVYEDPDYASPSSICAAPSCTRCITRGSDNIKSLCSSHHQHKVNSLQDVTISLDQRTLSASSSSASSKDVHCFDNNSYVEVELKPGKIPKKTQNPSSSNAAQPPSYFVRQSKFRHSHNQYRKVPAKPSNSERPSSLVLEDEQDLSEVFMLANAKEQHQQKLPASLILSPVTPSENTGVFFTQQRTKKQNRNPEQGDGSTDSVSFSMNLKKDSPTAFIAKPSSTSSSISVSRQSAKTSNSSKARKYSRSSSTSDLPPPPPPPPFDHKDRPKYAPQSKGTMGNPPTHENAKRTNSNSTAHGAMLSSRKLQRNFSSENDGTSQVSNHGINQNTVHHRLLAESREDETGVGGRRGSYSRACRKSQSCDHLYEQVIAQQHTENEFSTNRLKNNEENTASNAYSNSTTSVLHTSNSDTYLTPLVRSKAKLGNRNAPSPTFAIQGSSYPTDSYEVVMPVQKNNVRQRTSKAAANEDSINNEISTRSRCYDDGKPSFVHKHSASAGTEEWNIPRNDTDEIFSMNKEKLRNRRFSEGSTGNKQKDKLFPENHRSQLRRFRSVGCDTSVNKKKDVIVSRIQLPSPIQQQAYKTSGSEIKEPNSKVNSQQPRFPATNPYARADSYLGKKDNDCLKLRKNSKALVTPVDTSHAFFHHSSELAKASQSTSTASSHKLSESVTTAMESTAKGAADKMNRTEAKTKKTNKQANSSNSESKKKSSSGQSKSFVTLMKAKFSRSSSNRSSNEKQTKAMSSFPITPASSLIDPRTLSLEPNAHLPVGKDSQKDSKQTLGENSDAAVGKKLSQPFPNGIENTTRSQNQLNVLPEEPLPDEGFAEGSTIERPIKAEVQGLLFGISEKKHQNKSENEQYYINVDLSKKTDEKEQNINENNVELRQNASVNSYENFIPKQTEKIVKTDKPLLQQHSNTYQQKVEVKQSKNVSTSRVPLYENCKPQRYSTKNTNDSNLDAPASQPSYAADMIIATSCLKSQSVHSEEQIIATSLTSQKLSSASAFTRPVKQNNSREKSKSKRGEKTEFAPVDAKSDASNGSLRTEKDFISLMVKSELDQPVDARQTVSFPHFVENLDASRRLECSSLSSIEESVTTGSLGTISSLGSFPSDPFESSMSADALNTSDGSVKSPTIMPSLEIEIQNAIQDIKLNDNKSYPKKQDTAALSPKSKLPASKLSFSSSLPSPSSKDIPNNPDISSQTKKSGYTRPNHYPKKSDLRGRERSSTNTTTKSQIAIRPSKIASASKLPHSGKTSDTKATGKYAREKSISADSHQNFHKTQLSSPIPTAAKNRYVKRQILCVQPVYENLAIIKQQE